MSKKANKANKPKDKHANGKNGQAPESPGFIQTTIRNSVQDAFLLPDVQDRIQQGVYMGVMNFFEQHFTPREGKDDPRRSS